jgi:hypothetical protein
VGTETEASYGDACRRHHKAQGYRHGNAEYAPSGRCLEICQRLQGRRHSQEGDCGNVATLLFSLQCAAIDESSFSLAFRCPPDQDEYIRSGVAPVIIEGIENPTTLETKLLDEDGRIPREYRPHGNAFKTIRIIRGTEDIGSLFDVRMSAFDKIHGTGAE